MRKWKEDFILWRKEDLALMFEYCEMERKACSEKDRKEKESHIRETHTFKCTVCNLKHQNKEELYIHILTCEMYVCTLCSIVLSVVHELPFGTKAEGRDHY